MRLWSHFLPVVGVVAAVVLVGCPKPKPDPSVDATPPTIASQLTPSEAPPDPAHGKELVLTYQCNRCHDGTGHPAAVENKHCVHCHKDIMEDRFTAAPASLAKWKPR